MERVNFVFVGAEARSRNIRRWIGRAGVGSALAIVGAFIALGVWWAVGAWAVTGACVVATTIFFSPERLERSATIMSEGWISANPGKGEWIEDGPDRAAFLLAWWSLDCFSCGGRVLSLFEGRRRPGDQRDFVTGWLDVDAVGAGTLWWSNDPDMEALLGALENMFVKLDCSDVLVNGIDKSINNDEKAILGLGAVGGVLGGDLELWEVYSDLFFDCFGERGSLLGDDAAAVYREALELMDKIGILDAERVIRG